MSNSNCESSAQFAAPPAEKSSAPASAAHGLETIVLALQALQKEPIRKAKEEEPAVSTADLPIGDLPAKTSSGTPPLPAGINSAGRIVSTDTIGDSDTESAPLEHPPAQVKEEETASSSEKASDTDSSTPVESGTNPRSSPSISPPASQTSMGDSVLSSDDASKAADFSHILADPEGWLKKTDNLFAKLPPIEDPGDKEIVVQPNDVLCGRGGETNHHPGNIRYRSLVKAYQKLYLLAKRRDKPKIAQCIVVSVRGVEGRFLKRTKNGNKGPTWVDVGNVKAREKTSQALREGAPNLRENVTPPVTSTSSNDNTVTTTARQAPAIDQVKNIAAPPSIAPALPTGAPSALQAMMFPLSGAPMPPAPPVHSSSAAHASSSSSGAPSDVDNDAYMKIFTKATEQLMQHPAFHQLDKARQYEAILYECKNARAAVESAKRGSPTNVNETGRVSPKNTAAGTQPQQHHQPYPTHEYPYYNHGQNYYYPPMHGKYYPPDSKPSNPKAPAAMDTKTEHALSLLAMVAPQATKQLPLSVYRELLTAAKAPASANVKDEESASNEEQESTTKKRPLSSTASTSHALSSKLAVVSDTGSDTSSSSSTCESVSTAKEEAVTSVSRGGSRLKRLKLRMKDDFN